MHGIICLLFVWQVVASGPGLEKTGVTVNKWAEFVVDARRAGGQAPLHIAAMDADYNQVEVSACVCDVSQPFVESILYADRHFSQRCVYNPLVQVVHLRFFT